MQVSSAAGAQAADSALQRRERSSPRADQDGRGGADPAGSAAWKSGAGATEPAAARLAASMRTAVLAGVDANRDGLITAAELAAVRPGFALPIVSPAPALSAAAMFALLSGQEASGEGEAATAPTGASPLAGPAEPRIGPVEARDRYQAFSAGQPSAEARGG